MRFTADYDSEEEEFPVNDASRETTPAVGTAIDNFDLSSEDGSENEDVEYIDASTHFSPKASRDAWLAMYNKDREINRLNALNARSATKSFRNSLILDDLEAISVADFLRQLSLDDEGRRKTEEEDIRKRNADILDAIGRAINATKARAEKRRKEQEEERLHLQKLEQERRRQELAQQEKDRAQRERVLAQDNARKEAQKKAAAAKKQEEERARQAEEQARQLEKQKQTSISVPATISSSLATDPCEAEFDSHLATIESIKSSVLKACSENPTWKKACFELKRKITSRLGQLTNSRRQISRLVRDLLEVFEKGRLVDETVLTWLLNFFSKQVIKQAENEVVVQIPSAYPLAYVCIFLMTKYQNLKSILLARFAKNCPWTVPYYKDPNTEESMKRMGYKRTEDGKWEETTRYIERQSGIFAVWTAMTTHQLNPKAISQDADIAHPFPLANAWRWAARTLNHQATSEIECAMMATFLEVVNQQFVRAYRRQGQKVVNLAVGGKWVAGIRGPAAGRLEIMRDEFQRTGRIGEEGFGAFVP